MFEDIKARLKAITKGRWQWDGVALIGEKVLGHYRAMWAYNDAGTAGVGVISPDDLEHDTLRVEEHDADFISHAPDDIRLLLLHIEDRERVFDEMLNDLWALVYPDDPTGCEYPGQVYRHVREYINELKVGKANKQMESRLKRMGFHDLEGNSPR